MYGSELVHHLIDEIEREHCTCGAELDRDKPATWEHCGIHARCAQLRQAFRDSMPIS